MTVKLHLMDDRKIIKTVTVGDEGLQVAFTDLLDYLSTVLIDYPCEQSDIHQDFWSIIRMDIAKAKLHPPLTKHQVTEWYSEMFNVVYQETL